MKPFDALEHDLSKLAAADSIQPDFNGFRSGVWREIRHRQAVECAPKSGFPWQWDFYGFSAGRLCLAAAFLATTVGVALGFFATPERRGPRAASRNLDLSVFSNSASGLPSNFLVSRK